MTRTRFATLIVVLGCAALSVGCANAPTEVAATDVPPSVTPTDAPPTQTPLPLDTPVPTGDPLLTTGGFVENPLDATGFPEFEIATVPSGGGDGPAVPDFCPEVAYPQTVSVEQSEFIRTRRDVCIYDVPNITDGAVFTITLTSPSGNTYAEEHVVLEESGEFFALRDGLKWGTFEMEGPRQPLDLYLNFGADQEYGQWRIEAAEPDASPFAVGSFVVEDPEPVFTVSRAEIEQTPFRWDSFPYFSAGEVAMLSARGLEAGRVITLVYYAADPQRSNAETTVMIPIYASQITVAADGTFQTVLVIGSETPKTGLTAVFDPVAGEPFTPQPLGIIMQQD